MAGVARALAAALAAVAVLAACGAAGSIGGSASPGATPSVVLTEADAGQTVQLHLGDRAALRLPTTSVWSTPQASGKVLRLEPSEAANDPAFHEWTIVTTGRGTARLSSEGRPPCSPGAMCTQIIREFAVTIVVS